MDYKNKKMKKLQGENYDRKMPKHRREIADCRRVSRVLNVVSVEESPTLDDPAVR